MNNPTKEGLYRATSTFRWKRSLITIGDHDEYAGYIFVLQQKYESSNRSESFWMDVPVVDENEKELPTGALFFGIYK